MADVIPIFPLGHVLMPAMPLPLHIFEPRYRKLLADVQRGPGSAAFGVVVLRGGVEVQVGNTPSSTAPPIAAVGTLAEILEVEPYEDGAADLLTVGSRRFRILRVISGAQPYLKAEVEWLEEVDGDLRPQQVSATRRLCREYAALLEELTGRHRQSELPRDAALLSYHVAGELPLAPEDRQELLEKPTAAERLERGVRLLRRELSLLRATRSICVAPSVLQLVANPN